MEGFMTSAESFLKWLQMPSLIVAAIVICIGGYCWMAGGEQGRRWAKGFFIGAAVGLLVVNGALGIATSVNSNISF